MASAAVTNGPCCHDHHAARTGRFPSGSCLTKSVTNVMDSSRRNGPFLDESLSYPCLSAERVGTVEEYRHVGWRVKRNLCEEKYGHKPLDTLGEDESDT